MKFVMARDRVVTSVLGHSIEFKKGEPTYVPPALHAEVMSLGAEPEDADMPDPRDPKVPTGVEEPTDPTKRGEDILAAIELIAARNSREDFTAAGAPHLKVLNAMLGWNVSAPERDAQWLRFQAGKDD